MSASYEKRVKDDVSSFISTTSVVDGKLPAHRARQIPIAILVEPTAEVESTMADGDIFDHDLTDEFFRGDPAVLECFTRLFCLFLSELFAKLPFFCDLCDVRIR